MSKNCCVLVIDDEEGIRTSLAHYLELNGYKAETASDGIEGLGKIREKKIKIVLLDIMMPNVNGLELLEAIKAFDFSIQVIMMTAHSTLQTTIKALERGAIDYLLKPFDELEDVLLLVKLADARLQRWQSAIAASMESKE